MLLATQTTDEKKKKIYTSVDTDPNTTGSDKRKPDFLHGGSELLEELDASLFAEEADLLDAMLFWSEEASCFHLQLICTYLAKKICIYI